MDRLTDLLLNVERALAELADSKVQLESLEELLEGFERVDRVNRKELDTLRASLERETLACVQMRLQATEMEVLCIKTARAWRRARTVACLEPTPEESILDKKLEDLGWYEDSPKHEAG